MVTFRVTPHPSEAQLLPGQNQTPVLYRVEVNTAPGARGAGVPVFLAVILDQSGSMAGDKLASAKGALLKLLTEVPDSDDLIVHVILFSNSARELFPPLTGCDINRDIADISGRVNRIEALSGTDLSSGLTLGLKAAAPFVEYERRMLIVTDGQHASRTPLSEVYAAAEALAEVRIRLDAWGVGYGWDAEQLLSITRITSGEANVIPDAHDLPGEIHNLFAHVQHTVAGNVRLVLNTTRGTRITSARQVYPIVQDRIAQQVNERAWAVPVGAMQEASPGEETRLLIELETDPPVNDVACRVLVPSVLYNIGSDEYSCGLDRTSWFFVRRVSSPSEVKIDPELARFLGEKEVTRLSEEGFALLKRGAVEQATAKLGDAYQIANQLNSPQADVLRAMFDLDITRLVYTDVEHHVPKTVQINTGKTRKIGPTTKRDWS